MYKTEIITIKAQSAYQDIDGDTVFFSAERIEKTGMAPDFILRVGEQQISMDMESMSPGVIKELLKLAQEVLAQPEQILNNSY